MKKNINIVIDLNNPTEEVWKQMEAAYEMLKKLDQKKPWYKRIFSWF